MLILNKRQLKSILSFAGKKDERFYLNGLYFDGKYLSAINGACMALLTIDDADEPDDRLSLKYFISREVVETALSKMSAKDKAVLDIVEGVASIQVGDSYFMNQNSETHGKYQYPDFKRVICQNNGGPDGFNWYQPCYLQNLLDLMKAINERSYWKPEGFMHNAQCLGVRDNVNLYGVELTLDVAIMPTRM